jgi:molybdopterin converting factor small subunit
MEQDIRITVKLFSHARYHFGKSEIMLDLSPGSTVADVRNSIVSAAGGDFQTVPFRISRNHKFVSEDEMIQKGDELACIPPVQGG